MKTILLIKDECQENLLFNDLKEQKRINECHNTEQFI